MYHAYIYYNAGNSTAAYRVIKHRHRVDKYLRHLYIVIIILNIIDSESVESAVRVFVASVLLLPLRLVRDPFIGFSACRRIDANVMWEKNSARVTGVQECPFIVL